MGPRWLIYPILSYDALVNDTGYSSASNSLQCLRDLPFATLKAGVDKSPDFSAYDVGGLKCDGASTHSHYISLLKGFSTGLDRRCFSSRQPSETCKDC